ncbi:MAG: serine hydrolase domain-containing protein [Bacteroidota bacterium]
MELLRRNRYRFFLFIAGSLGITLLVVIFSGGMKPLEESGLAPETIGQSRFKQAVTISKIPEIPPFRDFIHYMDGELDSSNTVGAAYAMVQGGQVRYISTFGERTVGSGEEVNEHTLFRLASVSKGFAGTLACLLEQKGVFSLDDRVLDLYPGFSLKDSASTNGMTLRNLLSHTTGLVPYAFDNLVEEGETLPHIVDRLHEVDISAPPGTLYGYQNVTFSMLDPIARRATGTPYQVLMDQMIFKPLHMEDASVGPVEITPEFNMASPHVRGSDKYIPLSPQEGYYNVLPAAGVNASISDMGQWLLALLGHQPGIIPEAVLETLGEPVIYTPLKYRYTRYWKPFRERYYSLGWRIYQYRGEKILYHGGYIRGYRAEIGFCPGEDIGIVFLQNSPNSLASKVVPRFFDIYLDYREGVQGPDSTSY